MFGRNVGESEPGYWHFVLVSRNTVIGILCWCVGTWLLAFCVGASEPGYWHFVLVSQNLVIGLLMALVFTGRCGEVTVTF